MSDRVAQIVILAEDQRQVTLVRRYLRRANLAQSDRQLRVVSLPSGKRSGEQHVRENFASEVREYRRNSAKRRAALIVVIDADVSTVAQKGRDLNRALIGENEHTRRDAEAIALLIPRRNVETWILCLTGQTVDESTDYKHERGLDERILPAAIQLFTWTRPNALLPAHCVNSLEQAIPEIRRIEA